MPETLPDLVARLRATTPALADVPDDILTAEVARQLQARDGPSVGEAIGLPTFRTSNEKDAGGAAVVRAPESAWTKAATIGAPGLGDRYPLASVGEILASDNPLKLLAEYVTGPGRPRSVANADPTGIDAFTEGKGPMPMFLGTTEDVAGIRGYHGSPHDFPPVEGAPLGRFDSTKIGTGEGAQAYGHGLYFAEQEGTAKAYRDRLSGASGITPGASTGRGKLTVGGITPPEGIAGHKALDTAQDIQGLLYYKQQGYNDMADVVSQQIERRIENWRAGNPQTGIADTDMRALADYYEKHVKSATPDAITERPPGKMYEVQIKADPAHFLDWDAPLSAQHPQVQAAIAQMRADGVLGDETGAATTGAELLRSKSVLAPEHNLQRLGVPGIKYLDQGSRAAGEGSRNYVVFDDALIDILRKYGLLAPLAGASVGEALRAAPDRQAQ